ncbi:BQ5605_C007g04475 [Microbotryum silenes-dioicae]|uniref:BQ5605_C007g04475 protein n=1 Tax=Microbotryum silenes-dioicae TaxID=796604 RepID=A0A2X0MB95_9BASI|nr:BQ5605_C007g04475 [Microbotryum silenes-dioicae]
MLTLGDILAVARTRFLFDMVTSKMKRYSGIRTAGQNKLSDHTIQAVCSEVVDDPANKLSFASRVALSGALSRPHAELGLTNVPRSDHDAVPEMESNSEDGSQCKGFLRLV